MPSSNITQLLIDARAGDSDARDLLWEHVYHDLKEIAHRELRRKRPGQIFQTTELVHEAYLKLVDQTQSEWNDRLHFYAAAAKAMRHILIDFARRMTAEKRGGDQLDLKLNEVAPIADERAETLLALDEALSRLSALDARMGNIVEYRFFGGMTEAEIAEWLGVARRTVQRDWSKARVWLAAALAESSH